LFGFFHHREFSAQCRFWVDKVGRVQTTIHRLRIGLHKRFLVTALGAGSYDVTVGEELLGLFVVILFRLFFYDLPSRKAFLKNSEAVFVVHFGTGARIHIERNSERANESLMMFVVLCPPHPGGVIPPFLAFMVMGTPCSSLPANKGNLFALHHS
jgi:hypothetical protein